MTQQLSTITLGVADVARAKRFYRDGFGWEPAYDGEDIVFYQMDGLVFGLWGSAHLGEDMQRPAGMPGGFALAHNVADRAAVDAAIARLIAAGAALLRAPDEPPHGGYRGYIADPDGNPWEIATPLWPTDGHGRIDLTKLPKPDSGG